MSKWVENIDKKTYLLIDRKGGGQCVFFENGTKNFLTWSCCLYTVQRWRDARLAGRVRCWQVQYIQCRAPKIGQQKVQHYYKEDPLCSSGYIIYLCPRYTLPYVVIQ